MSDSHYTIYHKYGHKIGATADYDQRIKSYPPNTTVVLLELPKDQYTPQEIGDIEWGYADDFGYKRGQHYAIAVVNRTLGAKTAGRIAVESGQLASIQTFENQSAGGKMMKGAKWFNNSIRNTKAFTCPEGFVPGRLSRAS